MPLYNSYIVSGLLLALAVSPAANAGSEDIPGSAGSGADTSRSEQTAAYQPPKYTRSKPVPVNIYFGASWYQTILRVDEPAFDNLNREGRGILLGAGLGRHAFIGMRMGGFNFDTTEPTSNNAPPGPANYGFFAAEFGYKFLDIRKSHWAPWLALSMAYHDIGLSEWQYSLGGGCTTITAGMDLRLFSWLDVRGSANHCNMKLEETLFGGNDSRMKVTNYGVTAILRWTIRK